MYRQGDVLIVPIPAFDIAGNLTPVKPEGRGLILAYGEVTGHAHTVAPDKAQMWQDEAKNFFLAVLTPECFVVHDEHAPILLPPGNYKVVLQREYSFWDDEVRQVMD